MMGGAWLTHPAVLLPRQESKHFFFEKKKQKTFTHFGARPAARFAARE